MLESFIKNLEKVPPVPSEKNQREPLQASNNAAVPSVPPVPREITKVQRKTKTLITCGACLKFKAHNTHGKGAGLCLAGVGFVLWDNSPHECNAFDAAVEWMEIQEPKPVATMVTCYTPSGANIEIEARDSEHAAWLKQMNPMRTVL